MVLEFELRASHLPGTLPLLEPQLQLVFWEGLDYDPAVMLPT
jgi:hypothetical protein